MHSLIVRTIGCWLLVVSVGEAAGADSQPVAWSKHWAFQPIANPPIPHVKNRPWTQTTLDHFVLARLEQKGLRPAAAADRRTLLRRVTFDLLGLPPTPEEMAAFEADRAP